MDELTIGDKTYISSKKAAQITGYAKDYVGQLCRGGYVEARMVGRNWYVLESSIRAHRFGNETKKDQPIAEEGEVSGANPLHSSWEAPAYVPEMPVGIPVVAARPVVENTPEPMEIEDSTATDMQSAWKEWFARKQESIETPQIIEEREAEQDIEDHVSVLAENDTEEEPLLPASDREMPYEAPEASVRDEESLPVYSHPMDAEAFQEAYMAAHARPAEADTAQPVQIRRVEEPISRTEVPVATYKMEISPIHTRPSPHSEDSEPVIIQETIHRTKKGRRVHPTNTHAQGSFASSLALKTAFVCIALLAAAVGFLGSGFGDRYNYYTGSQYTTIHFFNGSQIYQSYK